MQNSASSLLGKQIGNYRLNKILGHGGFANVYLAENIHISTLAAIKVLHAQLEQSEMEHFRDEARTIASLKHAHIVQLLDFGIERSSPYLIMGYASNGTLRALHEDKEPVPLAVVVSYVRQIASALQFAHDHRIIHRDVKPENVLLSEYNNLLLTDFGIAIIAHTSHQQSTKDITGTFIYMAPEQTQGKPVAASDQYALGIMTYEWLIGAPPFQGSIPELIAQHFSAPPPSLRAKLPTLAPEVEQVILRALAKAPQDRFPSIQTFADELESVSKQVDQDSTVRVKKYIATMLTRTKPAFSSTSQVSEPLSSTIPPSQSFSPGSLPANPLSPPVSSKPQRTPPFPSREVPYAPQYPMYQSPPPPPYYMPPPTQYAYPPMVPQKRNKPFPTCLVVVIVLVVVISSIFACSSASLLRGLNSAISATPTTTGSQTATALPVIAHTLYHANWSKNLDGWQGESQWHHVDTDLIGSDGSSNYSYDDANMYSLLAPYQPPTTDYAVEAQIKFVRFNGDGDFGVLLRVDNNGDGYLCGFEDSYDSATPIISVITAGESSSNPISSDSNSNFTLDTLNFHTIRVEVNKDIITMFVDGNQLLQATDNSYLSAGTVGLRSNGAVFNVHSFQVMKL